MGNIKSINQLNFEEKRIFLREVKNFINEDKTSYNYITNLRKDNISNIKKKESSCIVAKSQLRENMNSRGLIDCSLELFSCLVSSTLNHEGNSTIYQSVTIPKISENNLSSVNDFDLELLGNQSDLLLKWIYNTYLTNKKVNFKNWLPISERPFGFDNLEDDYSSIHKDGEISNISEEKDLSLDKGKILEGTKNVKNQKNKRVTSSSNEKRGGMLEKSIKNKNSPPKNPITPSNLSPYSSSKINSKIINLNKNANATSPLRDVQERNSNPTEKNDDQRTVNSILNLMTKGKDKTDKNQEIKLNERSAQKNLQSSKILLKTENNSLLKPKEVIKISNDNLNYDVINDMIQTDNSQISQRKNTLIAFPTFKPIDKDKDMTINDFDDQGKSFGREINDFIKNPISFKETKENKELKEIKGPKKNHRKITNQETEKNNHLLSDGENKYETFNSRQNKSKSRSVSHVSQRSEVKQLRSQKNTRHTQTQQSSKMESKGNNGKKLISLKKFTISEKNINTLGAQNSESDKNQPTKEQNFADLILKNVSPLKNNKVLKKKEENQFNFALEDPELASGKKTKKVLNIKKQEKRPKSGLAKKEDNYTSNLMKSYNFKKNKKIQKSKNTNKIRIDLRVLLDEVDYDKNDSSKSSTILFSQGGERSKSKEITPNNNLKQGYRTTSNSIKILQEIERSHHRKTTPGFKRPSKIQSSLDFASKLKKISTETPSGIMEINGNIIYPDDSKNMNLNIQINSNNINNINTYSQSSSSIMQLNRPKSRMSNLNISKKIPFGGSNKRSSKILYAESKYNTPKIDFNEIVGNLDLPKFNLDLTPLGGVNNAPYDEVLKQLKENNKFLFEVTNEEKNLNEKIKAFNYDKVFVKE